MASFSNLMVTPPTNGARKHFIDVSDSNSEDSLHTRNIISKGASRWYSSLCKFHKGRVLEVSCTGDLPKTKEALQKKLSIEIERTDTCSKANTVYVVPLTPETLDPLCQDWTQPLDTKCRFSSSESYLCLSCLPQDVNDEKSFVNLVSKFGPIVTAFLVYHHQTDECLGIGLVEYCSREVAFQARNLLHQNRGIFCDWLDHRVVTYSCLYSKCLLARSSGLSEEQLRKEFSITASPIYCKVVPGTDVAVVEYLNPDEAMSTYQSLLNMSEDKQKAIQDVHLAPPGKTALKLHEKILVDKKVNNKVENTLVPMLPIGHIPFSLLGHHLRLLGSLFPAPLTVPSPSRPLLSLVGCPRTNDVQPITTSLINAFGFDLPCSPILQAKRNTARLRSTTLQGPTNAFGFPLPCSPLHKILGLQVKPLTPEKKIKETESKSFSAVQLRTPPAWKNFKLQPFSISPDKPVLEDTNSDPTLAISRVLESTVLKTPPQATSSWSSFSLAGAQNVSERTPLRISAKRQGKRLLDCHHESDENDKLMGKVTNRNGLKKRFVLSQVDNTINSSWQLDSTWTK